MPFLSPFLVGRVPILNSKKKEVGTNLFYPLYGTQTICSFRNSSDSFLEARKVAITSTGRRLSTGRPYRKPRGSRRTGSASTPASAPARALPGDSMAIPPAAFSAPSYHPLLQRPGPFWGAMMSTLYEKRRYVPWKPRFSARYSRKSGYLE